MDVSQRQRESSFETLPPRSAVEMDSLKGEETEVCPSGGEIYVGDLLELSQDLVLFFPTTVRRVWARFVENRSEPLSRGCRRIVLLASFDCWRSASAAELIKHVVAQNRQYPGENAVNAFHRGQETRVG